MRREAWASPPNPPLAELEGQVTAFIGRLCRLLIDDATLAPDAVRVTMRFYDEPGGSLYRFYVAVPEEWRGLLIGRGGSTADAIRTMVRSYVSRHHCRDTVEVRIQRAV